jgi:hypothetical protein
VESDYFWKMIWRVFWVVVVVVGNVRVPLSKVKEKQKLNDLTMYAIVEAQKRKGKAGGKESVDPSASSGQAAGG